MSERVILTGIPVVVKHRSTNDRYFITFPSLGLELVMAFKSKVTATEIAANCLAGTPFFQMIPTVPIDTEYPRKNLIYPKVGFFHNIPVEMGG